MNSKKYNFVYLNAKYLSGLRIINIKNLEEIDIDAKNIDHEKVLE